MKEFRITWCACPHNHNRQRLLFVKAANAEDAKAIAHDHIERNHGIAWFTIFEPVIEAKPVPAGKVMGTA